MLHTGQKGHRINDKEYEIAQKMKAIIDISKLEGIISLIESGIIEISRNANPRICFMAKSIQLGAVMKGEELSLV